jgi:HNH endonuclease
LSSIWYERLRTPRGIAAAVFVGLVLISAASSKAGSAGVVLILSPLIWWVVWGILGLFRGIWEGLVDGSTPSYSVGRAWQTSGLRKQLRQDGNASIFVDRGGILLRQRFWFVGSGTPPIRLSPKDYETRRTAQLADPVLIGSHRDRDFWWYRDEFFWTNNDEYDGQDIKALLFARERQRQRELDHAHALMAAAGSPAARKREPIPKDVKLAVFKRDEGKCAECGSDFDIQYDHIIPFSMGGSNSVENLQLLCARCNQQKGGRL